MLYPVVLELSFMLCPVMSALRASDGANPPRNMHRALVFNGATICTVTASILLLRGRQRRRENDEIHASGNMSDACGDSQETSGGAREIVGDGQRSAEGGGRAGLRLPLRLKIGS